MTGSAKQFNYLWLIGNMMSVYVICLSAFAAFPGVVLLSRLGRGFNYDSLKQLTQQLDFSWG
jgi:hypothetical protein